MADEVAVLFLDTNILLHFRPLQEIDWRSVAGLKTVRLVICLPVLDELDEKKHDRNMGKRARSAIAQIDEIKSQGGQVVDDVTLETFGDPDKVEGIGDDAIIQHASQYASSHEAERMVVVSNDRGMRLRCGLRNIECITLDEKWEKPFEDESDRKRRLAEEERYRLKNCRPDFSLLGQVAGDHTQPPSREVSVVLVKPAGPQVDLPARMAHIKDIYPKRNRDGLFFAGMKLSTSISGTPDQIDRYNAELDDYYTRCEAALESHNKEAEALARSFCFDLHLDNDGSAPGNDVEIYVRFPGFVTVQPPDQDVIGRVPMPDPPGPPGPLADMIRTSLEPSSILRSLYPSALLDMKLPHNVSAPTFHHVDDGTEVRQSVQRSKHLHSLSLASLRVAYPAWDSVKPFHAGVSIYCDELPDPVEHKLVFGVSVSKEAEASTEGTEQ